MNSQREDPERKTDAVEGTPLGQPAAGQTSGDEAELSDQDLENVAGGARGVAIGTGIRIRSNYSDEAEVE
ncbi:MAG TPA: hypothetical protein VER55_10670 [Ardenticatenaceae bacterium]|nr:hypothetical protein [Ardenticatenaceae bacterium]